MQLQPKPHFGPDRSPRPARFKVPPKACDSHAHIYGPRDRFPYGRVVPPELQDATVEDYEKTLGTLGIERAVLTQGAVYGEDNRAILDALERTENLRGIVMMT